MDDIYLYILYIVYVGSVDGKEEKKMGKDDAMAYEPLDAEEEELVRAYMSTGSYTDGYKMVYPDWAVRTKDDSVSVCKAAGRVYTPKIRREIARQKRLTEKAQQKAAEKTAKEEYEELRKLWSRRDSVEHLVSIIADCQRTREDAMADGDGVPVSVSRLERDTIDTVDKLMGYDAPQEIQQDTTITVGFGAGLDDFAV